MDNRLYTRAEVASLLKVSPRKIEVWAARGVMRPVSKAQGKGKHHQFTFAEVVRAYLIQSAQEDLGSQFFRPGHLAKLLHEKLTESQIVHEGQNVWKKLANKTPTRRRVPAEKGDWIVYLYRDRKEPASEQEKARKRVEWILEDCRRGDPEMWPSAMVSMRFEMTLAIHSLVYRILKMPEVP